MKNIHQTIVLPDVLAKPGFYYHYKHNPDGPFNNYAYYIFGTGHHTEEDARPEDKFMQVYVPLYESALVYQMGRMFDLRPLSMATGELDVAGYSGPRFNPIEDPEIIELLKQQGREMYGPWPW